MTAENGRLVRPITATALPASQELGRALHVHRLAAGLSLRVLARRIGMSAHSGLVDYERGDRIMPEDLAVACERALQLPPGYLISLRRRALVELAERKLGHGVTDLRPRQHARQADADLADDDPPVRTGWSEDVAAIATGLRQFVWLVCSVNARIAGRSIRWAVGQLGLIEPSSHQRLLQIARHPLPENPARQRK